MKNRLFKIQLFRFQRLSLVFDKIIKSYRLKSHCRVLKLHQFRSYLKDSVKMIKSIASLLIDFHFEAWIRSLLHDFSERILYFTYKDKNNDQPV